MGKTSFRALLRSLLVATAVMMTPWAAAQVSAAQKDSAAPGGPAGGGVETASLEELPSAPNVASSASLTATPRFSMAATPVMPVTTTPRETVAHRFWDRENSILFVANAGFAAADFAVTYSNLQHGGKELNPVTRIFTGSTPGLAANFAMETGGVIGVSYLFHKTGHHKLERISSIVNIGGSAGAVAYGLAHR